MGTGAGCVEFAAGAVDPGTAAVGCAGTGAAAICSGFSSALGAAATLAVEGTTGSAGFEVTAICF